MSNELNELSRQFHHELVELVKRYQFRDRNEIVCCGLSVSQCYVLETLNTHGTLNVQDLADRMHLKISTITRVVDQLVMKKYVDRISDPKDNRYRLIMLTKEGNKAYQKAWAAVFASERSILENIKPEDRGILISLLKDLNRSFAKCCDY